jgi:small subunit ribosomal protein S17
MPKRRLTGKVVSAKMQKTAVVAVEKIKKHQLYEKDIKRTKKYKVRDEVGVNDGDTVVIEESRPFSKSVNWKIIEVLGEEN